MTFLAGLKQRALGNNMGTKKQNRIYPILKLPSRLLLFSLLLGLLIPFIARLPIVPVRGFVWFTDYFPGVAGLLFISAFNLIPSIAWYATGKGSKRAPLAFWFSVAAGVGFLLWSHGSVNLRSSSTAAIALVFLPIYSAGTILAGWIMGLLVHVTVKAERMRVWMVAFVGVLAVVVGSGIAVQESLSIVARESRFPFIAVADMPLEKRQIYGSNFMGRVEVLAFGDFDNTPGNEIVALGTTSLTTLQPATYEVKSKNIFEQEDCDG